MDNALTTLGVQDKEDIISNLLVYCINSSPEFAQEFVSLIAPDPPAQYHKVGAFSRKQVPDTGVPDIVLVASNNDSYDIIIIENKLKAEEGKDQTLRYAEPGCVDALQHSLHKHIPSVPFRQPRYTFLTLFPDQKPECKEFHHVTYQELVAEIGTSLVGANPLMNQLWGDFASVLTSFYAAGETAPTDLVIDHLCQDEGLDGSFLCFTNLIRITDYPAGLAPEDICRRSWSGRKCYLATITKDDWHLDDNGACLPYTIHIEPQFDCLWKRFPVFVHYELYPYEKEKDAKKRHTKEELAHYTNLREEFKAYMKAHAPAGFAVRGGWNQVGRTEIALDADTTLDQLHRKLVACVTELQQVIDGFPGLR